MNWGGVLLIRGYGASFHRPQVSSEGFLIALEELVPIVQALERHLLHFASGVHRRAFQERVPGPTSLSAKIGCHHFLG